MTEEKKYIRKLKKCRTSIFRYFYLVIFKKFPLKLAVYLIENPIEMYYGQGIDEEILTSFAGLKIYKSILQGKKYFIYFKTVDYFIDYATIKKSKLTKKIKKS